MKEHRIAQVEEYSIAEEMGIEPGDVLLAVDDKEIEDVFDYEYAMQNDYVEVLVRKPDGEEWLLEVEKDPMEDLGISFENGLMDEYRHCHNKCIFCFIDQMPPGMRDTLYFKDDDARLSFLQGNYISLTALSEKDLERILLYHWSPINISVHTTNPELRCRMLNNRFAGEALAKMDRLRDADIPMNGQIVLCKGYNDGAELDRTLGDLLKYAPQMQSVSVVPVGLTKYREKLAPLEPIEKAEALETLRIIDRWRAAAKERIGSCFVYASDEFFLLAEKEIPPEEYYEGFPQLENGVGMLRLLLDEVEEELAVLPDQTLDRTVSVATGRLAAPVIREIADRLCGKAAGLTVNVYEIRNDFFGERITVAGLTTGQDILAQLTGKPLGDCLLLPICMFRSGEEVFLDDVTRSEVSETLQVPVYIVESSGKDLIRGILGQQKSEGSHE